MFNSPRLIAIEPSFFQNRNQVAFKAEKAEYVLRKAEDFKLSQNADYKNNVLKFFDDNKQVSINVSDKTLGFLKEHFYSGNFIQLKDNSIGLSGDAGAFVEGWYKDIVYNRGFLQNNLNQNDSIEGGVEHIGFKNSLSHESSTRGEGDYLVFGGGKNSAYQNGKIDGKDISLNELMDISLQSDKNRNGEITFLEAYAGKDKLSQGYENWLNQYMREYFNDENINIQTYGLINTRINNEKAMEVGIYGTSIFETSLYGGIKGLSSHKFKQLEEELSPEVESKDEVQIEKPNKKEKSEYEEALLLKYPEFKALIEARGSENISEAELEDLRQKKKIATSYQENSQNITLKQEFTQTVFKTDLLI